MNALLDIVLAQVSARVEQEIKQLFAPVAPYLRRLGIGLALLLVSAGMWLIGLLFILIGLFFSLSSPSVYTHAAFWTAGVSLIIAASIAGIGISQLKQPR